MMNSRFEAVYDNHGHVGVQEKEGNHKCYLVAHRSKHASYENNLWLEKQLIKAYSRYYIKVLVDTFGRF